MRFLFVVVAGAIGWLWYAARAPAEAPPPPSPQVRQANLTGLGAQVAAARSAVIPAIEREVDLETDEPELAVDELDESEEAGPALADIAEQAQLAVFDRPPPTDAIDLSQHVDYGEVIVIEGHAPIIDTTSVSRCGLVVEDNYIKNIPIPGRTFESTLGAAIIDDEVVILSSGAQLENTYIIEDVPAVDQPAVDQPAVDQPAVDQPAEIPNNFLEETEVIGAYTYAADVTP